MTIAGITTTQRLRSTVILLGEADRILPPDATSRKQAKMIKDVKLVERKGGRNGIL